jgi:hypothetical protein
VITVRPAGTDADLEAWIHVRRIVLPNESAGTVEWLRARTAQVNALFLAAGSALKQRQIAWGAANGLREIVTWTQRRNEGMRAVNERLGYAYRSVAVRLVAPLPLAFPGDGAR